MFFKYLVEFTSKATRCRVLLCWRIFDYCFFLAIDLFRFSIFLHDLVLAGFVFLGICPFPLDYPVYWYNNGHSILQSFTSVESVVMFLLSFLILVI